MLEFFLLKPLWMKAAMVAGAGALGYGTYKFFGGGEPDYRRHMPRGGSPEANLRTFLPAGTSEPGPAQPIMPSYAYPPEHEFHQRWQAYSQQYHQQAGGYPMQSSRPAPPTRHASHSSGGGGHRR